MFAMRLCVYATRRVLCMSCSNHCTRYRRWTLPNSVQAKGHSMSGYTYVVTSHKPTVVQSTMTGNFTSATDRNLIAVKSTRLELSLLTPDGLQPMFDIPLYGRVATVQIFRPKGSLLDRLFVCTESFKFCVLAFDSKTKRVVTKATGDLRYVTSHHCAVSHAAMIVTRLCSFSGTSVAGRRRSCQLSTQITG